jgi:replicative DNA helicase
VQDLLVFDYSSRATTMQIYSRALAEKQKNPKIKAFWVDYLSLVKSATKERFFSREREVAAVTQEIKRVAKKLDMTAFVLAQLSRRFPQEKKRKKGETEDAEPQLHHLRECGSIEQDADVVIFLWYADTEEEEKDDARVSVKVAKNKDGRLGRASLLFRKRFQQFSDPSDAQIECNYYND